MNITHLNSTHQVTGSAHLLQANGLKILLDCGLAQGRDALVPMEQWPVSPPDLDFLFLTHAHIDHVGRLPELIRKGFKGEIITTHATKALLGPMLRDAMGFTDMTDREIEKMEKRIDDLSWGFEYGETFDLRKGVRFKLGRAGHILGSCFVRFEAGNRSVVFSGDLGGRDAPILPDPDPPDPCDVLVLESTYGDRNHGDRRHRVERLARILAKSLSDQGKVLIPAFALGRTQELLFELDRIFTSLRGKTNSKEDEKQRSAYPAAGAAAKGSASSEAILKSRRDDPNAYRGVEPCPVFLDTPLGLEITKIYSSLSEYWDREAKDLLHRGDHPIDFDRLYSVGNHRDHLKLLDVAGPCVILAGSGMCTGGRIVDHLVRNLVDPTTDVLFVGYQSNGTPGRDLIRYASKPDGYVRLGGERLPINARIHVLSGYSAHADQKGLIEWVEAMPEKPGEIRLVHGEPPAQKTLADLLKTKRYGVRLDLQEF